MNQTEKYEVEEKRKSIKKRREVKGEGRKHKRIKSRR